MRSHPQDRPHVLDPKHDELVTGANGGTQEGGTQGTDPQGAGTQGTESPTTGTQAVSDASLAKEDPSPQVVNPVVSSDASKGASGEKAVEATPKALDALAGKDIKTISLEDSLKALPDWAIPLDFLKKVRPSSSCSRYA